MEIVFDIEGDGLLEEITKIHCLSYNYNGEIKTLFSYNEMRELLSKTKVLIGHNIVTFDIPALEKILGIKIKARLVDTLALSWYVNHNRNLHGLESYGKDYGFHKTEIDNWKDLSREKYQERCERDVLINTLLWKDIDSYLDKLYPDDKSKNRLINYLSFKMDCLREQERSGWHVDVEKAKKHYEHILKLEEEKKRELSFVMPNVRKFVRKSRPKKPYKMDGSYSVVGWKWFKLLEEKGLPKDYDGEVEVFHKEEEPNPGSSDQVKDWLFSLGWKPCTFKYVKNDEGERKIPQIRKDGELTPSVRKLIKDNPSVSILDGLTILQHRKGIFANFIKFEQGGKLKAGAHGLTNTLRFKHVNPLTNLPGVDKPWGKEIRGCLIAPEGYTLCGSDMVSLEDTTKRHYMYNYDPEYVKEMSKDGFDPHLDLAKFAGAVTDEEIQAWRNGEKLDKDVKSIRKDYKAANYSCIYGVGAPKLSRELNMKFGKAKKLIEAYWERNWSVKRISANVSIKKVGNDMWLLNPVSGFYLSLRHEKDIFSTLNQSTGVYCFDLWIREFRKIRPQLTGQFHDEVILCIKEGFEDRCESLLKRSIKKVNDLLKLNVKLDIDVQFGKNYSLIH